MMITAAEEEFSAEFYVRVNATRQLPLYRVCAVCGTIWFSEFTGTPYRRPCSTACEAAYDRWMLRPLENPDRAFVGRDLRWGCQ